MDSIWGDNENPDSDELFNRIKNLELNKSVNSVIVLPYVDHQAGLSFQTVASCLLEDDRLTVYKKQDDFQVASRSRWDAVSDFEFVYLDDLNINADFDIEDYKSHAMDEFKFYNDDEKILVLRLLPLLDKSRNEEYPDDILVFFFKKGCNPEGMWVRYEDYTDDQEILGRLLNQPNQNMGVNEGDMVKFSLSKDNDGEIFCICDLDE